MTALGRHRASAIGALFSTVATVAGAEIGVGTGGLVGSWVANAVVLVITVVGVQWYLGHSLGPCPSAAATLRSATGAVRSHQGLAAFAIAM